MTAPLMLRPDRLLPAEPAVRVIAVQTHEAVRERPIISLAWARRPRAVARQPAVRRSD
jgi:hypothetical protein